MTVAEPPTLTVWRCDGIRRDLRPCGRLLMELDPTRPSLIVKCCDRCGSWNHWEDGRHWTVAVDT